ncbi:hypothetical protein Poly24_00500 [Rosistilla carotiformis]|uniref:Nucleotide-diphospho-sugar transferase n=1 Tax=Rosistilla carotiformis TaxID=2528017 RepID=A0A518JLE1_9BACT|nr:hypothetical protein [Rosistilla carotiformis]QDV66366.1 hypothetical protein Poly24_00500 [Rosistilla carotiformis]
MVIDKIITLANERVRLQLNVLIRSLRNVGCDLPVWVIPYDDRTTFQLPEGCQWWANEELYQWIGRHGLSGNHRQFQTLTTSNFQYADVDIVFLADPRGVLESHTGLVTADTEWSKPFNVAVEHSKALYAKESSTWMLQRFNAGQFALDRKLYESTELIETAESENCAATCIGSKQHAQPGVNLLVHQKGVKTTNLTLAPHNLQSTWAGDYPGEYDSIWGRRGQPYLIHYAGESIPYRDLPINRLFKEYLSSSERVEWEVQCEDKLEMLKRKYSPPPIHKRILHRLRPIWNRLLFQANRNT